MSDSLLQYGLNKQRGAVEACWAHNSEVGRSKLFAANFYFCTHTYTAKS